MITIERVLPRRASTFPYPPPVSRLQHKCGAQATKLGVGRRQRIVCLACAPSPAKGDKIDFDPVEAFPNRAARRRA